MCIVLISIMFHWHESLLGSQAIKQIPFAIFEYQPGPGVIAKAAMPQSS